MPFVHFDRRPQDKSFALVEHGRAAAIYLPAQTPESVRTVAEAFCNDVQSVSGVRPQIIQSIAGHSFDSLVVVGVEGYAEELTQMQRAGKLDSAQIDGKWESAMTSVVDHPLPNVGRALIIAGSDRRGAAFALFALSRQMGVSPWVWWADVPVQHHAAVYLSPGLQLQQEPSVPYRGVFLNDEDWGLRPWAARKMDPALNNIGPHTYARIFELLLRLRANTLWPAMHPGTLPFNAVPENAKLADHWGIVMGSSHSEALLRNNVGEWDETRDGPWNYQTNHQAIDAYWQKRVMANGKYENFYTVGMRGVHDTGLEATGTPEVKARLVEDVMKEQRRLLQTYVNPDLSKIPQVLLLYKESLELYRAGMRVPDDVTLGWTDDNYGYLRQLPTPAEQRRSGGSGVYYHVSYWGFPHDYLWLCSTPPALIREEMTKAFDHRATRYWMLNVGDIKPAEADIDYFMQLAWDEPRMARIDQQAYLETWASEQFSSKHGPAIADLLRRYYAFNFVRKPEFMGFNGYDDGIQRTAFNPLAWSDQNRSRLEAWRQLRSDEIAIAHAMPATYHDAFFELVAYPIEAAAAQNEKLLLTDRSYLDAARHNEQFRKNDVAAVKTAYDRIQQLTAEYDGLGNGKWADMMSAAPRNREVFKLPQTATEQSASQPLPASWKASLSGNDGPSGTRTGANALKSPAVFSEQQQTVSINASHFEQKLDGANSSWNILRGLGISGDSIEYGAPGLLANEAWPAGKAEPEPWLSYSFSTTSTAAPAKLKVFTLPTFPIDAEHHLRYRVAIDERDPVTVDLGGSGDWKENSAPIWAANVLRNASISEIELAPLQPGRHTLRLLFQDPGVVFEHLTLIFPGAPPAYPVPPETRASAESALTLQHQPSPQD